MAPTLYWGLRLRETTYLYEDPENPDRVTRTVASPDWSEDDRTLAAALQWADDQECPGCHQPREIAWHSDMEGWYDPDDKNGGGTIRLVCHGCSAKHGHEVVYSIVHTSRDFEKNPIRVPFKLGSTTTPPTDRQPTPTRPHA